MELNKEFIEYFNKNKDIDKYRDVIDRFFDKSPKCRKCNDVIYYYDSTFKISKGVLMTKGKSFNSEKFLDNKYLLSICERCLCNKYPEYESKNKSRVFNQMNYITEYCFNIPSFISLKWKKKNYAVTEKNMTSKFGDEIGKIKWNDYIQKQKLSNEFEYKSNKYGWTREKFGDYNKSRSITLEKMILKHGENLGLIKWNDYLEKQRLTKSKDYFVDKYGYDFWLNLCKSKAHTIENYLKRYKCEKIANKKLIEFYSKLNSPSVVSKSSQNYFDKLDIFLNKKFKTYYYRKDGKEYGKNLGKRWVYLDYYISELNLCIEYNGDLFHANPSMFGPNDEPIPFNNIKSTVIWKNDRERIQLLKDLYNIETIVIWESSLPNIEFLVKEIEKYENRI